MLNTRFVRFISNIGWLGYYIIPAKCRVARAHPWIHNSGEEMPPTFSNKGLYPCRCQIVLMPLRYS